MVVLSRCASGSGPVFVKALVSVLVHSSFFVLNPPCPAGVDHPFTSAGHYNGLFRLLACYTRAQRPALLLWCRPSGEPAAREPRRSDQFTRGYSAASASSSEAMSATNLTRPRWLHGPARRKLRAVFLREGRAAERTRVVRSAGGACLPTFLA